MCNIAGCNNNSGEEMFCDSHRCKGLTAKGKRCKSSHNCGIVHASYMENVVPVEDDKALVLHCLKCSTEFSAVQGTPEAKAMAKAYTDSRGICKRCRSVIEWYGPEEGEVMISAGKENGLIWQGNGFWKEVK